MSAEIDDPSHAAERTVFAWQRSALSLGAVGAVFLRVGTSEGTRPLLLAAGVALILAALIGSLLSQHLTTRRRASAAVGLTALTLAVAALAVAGSFVAA